MFDTPPFGELVEEDFEPITDLRDDENLFVREISFFYEIEIFTWIRDHSLLIAWEREEREGLEESHAFQ